MKIAIRLGERDDPEQAVLELRAALQIGAPVARVHVADADEQRRPGERPPVPPEAGLGARGRGTVPWMPSRLLRIAVPAP